MAMIFLGVDPGLTGAAVLITEYSKIIEFYDFRSIDKDLDFRHFLGWLKAHTVGNPTSVFMATLEEPIAYIPPDHGKTGKPIPPLAKKSPLSLAMQFKYYGMILAVVGGLDIKLRTIASVSWKRAHKLTKQNKDASRRRAIELFPEAAPDLARKRDHGRAEALLINSYGRSLWIRDGFGLFSRETGAVNAK